MKVGTFQLLDGFEFSSNGFKFKTCIIQIETHYSGIHNGVIEFAMVYNLGIDVWCMGQDHYVKKALDSLSSDELADENRIALGDPFAKGNTFTFEKDGHTFYATVQSVSSEAEYKRLYNDWDYPDAPVIVNTRLASVKYTVNIEVIEISPEEVIALSKFVGDGR